MSVVEAPLARVAGRELQPLARFRTPHTDHGTRFGWTVRHDDEPQLGPMFVVALKVGSVLYLLRSFTHDVNHATMLETPSSGDPKDQLRRFLEEILLNDDVTHWWDGKAWNDTPLPWAA